MCIRDRRNLKIKLPKYRMKNWPITQYRRPQCPPRQGILYFVDMITQITYIGNITCTFFATHTSCIFGLGTWTDHWTTVTLLIGNEMTIIRVASQNRIWTDGTRLSKHMNHNSNQTAMLFIFSPFPTLCTAHRTMPYKHYISSSSWWIKLNDEIATTIFSE